jgi:hypothetical protein
VKLLSEQWRAFDLLHLSLGVVCFYCVLIAMREALIAFDLLRLIAM